MAAHDNDAAAQWHETLVKRNEFPKTRIEANETQRLFFFKQTS